MKKFVLGLFIVLVMFPTMNFAQNKKQLVDLRKQPIRAYRKILDSEVSIQTAEIKNIPPQNNSNKTKSGTRIPSEVAETKCKSNTTLTPDEKKDYTPQISGNIYANYNWNYTGIGKEKDENRFEVERLYLTAKSKLSEEFSMRATLDVYTSKMDANLNSAYILKYGYLDWKASEWLTVRGGMIPTEWVGHVEDIWKFRGIAKVMSDIEGLQSSSDVGISTIAKLPSNLGEVVLLVLNGNGYRKAENNRFKDIAGRITISPFFNQGNVLKKLKLSAHFYSGRYSERLKKERWGIMLSLPFEDFSIALDYDTRKDSTIDGAGVSLFGELQLKSIVGLNNYSLIGRIDSFDPNINVAGDKHLRLIYGIAYKASANVTLVLNNQSMAAEKDVYKKYDGSLSKSDGKIFLNLMVSY